MSLVRDTHSNTANVDPKTHVMTLNLRNQLRFYLEHREVSATELARKAKVPKQNLSGWLAGKRPADISQVKRVAEALGISLDNLLFGNGAEKKEEKAADLETLLGDNWLTGLFEVKLRRIKR